MINKMMKNKGFTLLEMLVSLTLFSFVITISLTSLYMIMKLNEKTKVMKTIINNVNIALEGMSREIRVGYGYRCYLDECTKFEFKTKNGCDAYYEFKNNSIYKKITSNTKCSYNLPEVRILSDDVVVDSLKFRTAGIGVPETQPRVLVNIKASVNKNNHELDEDFVIQTTISQRRVEP